ncbi:MAG: hypothetical protein HZA52_03790 [Planctomycetes bacterium]|nr:hypothetical protein [Planctomycetota bacterium]
MSHLHVDPETALELALAPVGDPRRRAAQSCATCRAELERSVRELAQLEALRAAFEADPGAARVRRLIERTLAATTREDLSWRGTARLWTQFARRRLAESAGLRWLAVAAGLQLLALPVVAWWALSTRAPGGDPVVEAPPPEPRASIQVAEIRLGPSSGPSIGPSPAPNAPALADARRVTELEVENALARDRLTLDRALRSPLFERTSAVRRPGELLACRVERWRGETCGVRAPGTSVSGIEAVLWADILLDDFVRDARAGGELAYLLSTCRSLAASRRPEAELARLTVERARRYGILADAPSGSRAADAAPFDDAWFRALTTAVAAASSQDDPTVRAWLAFGGPATRAR